MKERPILFSGRWAAAAHDGTKSQTRRVVVPQPPTNKAVVKLSGGGFHLFTDRHTPGKFRVAGPVWAVRELMGDTYPKSHGWTCKFGVPGDRLWVREQWAPIPEARPSGYFTDPKWIDRVAFYAADNDKPTWAGKWKPSIRMFRWASRTLLDVVDVRIERLQDITEADIVAEGVRFVDGDGTGRGPGRKWNGRAYESTTPGEWHTPACGNGNCPCFGLRPDGKTTYDEVLSPARCAWRQAWDALNFERGYGWEANPLVWVIGFKKVGAKRGKEPATIGAKR